MSALREVIDIPEHWSVYLDIGGKLITYTCVHPVYRTIIFQQNKRLTDKQIEKIINNVKSL